MIASTTSTPRRPAPSMLDDPPPQFCDAAFFSQTLALLRAVRDHDFDTLAALCDDDFGIVDVDPSGAARPLRDRTEWEAWFHDLFATLDAMTASTDSRIENYQAIEADELGYSVLDFTQTLTVGDRVASFECVATIIWKRTEAGWREARWHASVISSDVPPEMRPTS
jgi:ketosteroid isomerase-like protein